ncbi:hypothetical protein SRRS_15130 [Sporomusa rhizae]|uniref:hypothetical protein n=1 Tax=Sporomusa rhizae TaxID=357999 RepID=UPI00352B79AC
MDKDNLERVMIEEIKLVQDITKRMSGNSFLIKGWTLTLVVAALLFKVDHKVVNQVPLACIPLVMFWFLDTYYLRQEKLFRRLHCWIIKHRLNTSEYLFDFSTSRFENEVPNFWKVAVSKTLLPFYGLIALLIYIYWAFMR